MAVIRLIILVSVLGGLTLLLAQNFSPALPLVFLGARTQPFPLAMWLLFSTVAGATTSLIVNSLFGFAGYFTQSKKFQASSRANSNRKDTQRRDSQTQNTQYKNTVTDKEDDWDLDGTSEDWDFEERARKSPQEKQDRISDEEMYERRQTTNSSKADTSYSYSSREPKDSGVGKTESIYDADYRVIVPPYNPAEPNRTSSSPEKKQSDDDDWSFFDEDNEKNEK
ncbi:hypothetical protein NIES4071_46410 [Calothrix sp. NIES-4071]|nr:hypothetical protein NIES4071_46410 [Calothrix sp. NIES-4071]BAZ58952.1 hypothetical protein NIES4105_46340 [Calothrix sp. NIES-4105]